jgi:FKBP-type peptidyl-prolyl cis-trans isomerase
MRVFGFASLLLAAGWRSTGLAQESDDLVIEVTFPVSCDRKTHNGDVLSVNYNGTFTNGTVFDSSAYHELHIAVLDSRG